MARYRRGRDGLPLGIIERAIIKWLKYAISVPIVDGQHAARKILSAAACSICGGEVEVE